MEKTCYKNHCLALVNGESIGQVASQTLDSMNVINQVISIPVLRPVLCLDKLEIIDIAQKIDTYDISIRPHEIVVQFLLLKHLQQNQKVIKQLLLKKHLILIH
ncbi:MAG: hypothetical protein ACLR43_02955 [Faecalibacillus faecis]